MHAHQGHHPSVAFCGHSEGGIREFSTVIGDLRSPASLTCGVVELCECRLGIGPHYVARCLSTCPKISQGLVQLDSSVLQVHGHRLLVVDDHVWFDVVIVKEQSRVKIFVSVECFMLAWDCVTLEGKL